MLPLHPITGDYHDFTEDETLALRKDLRKHGLRVPIVTWKGAIVDGRNRALICEELEIEPRYDDISSFTEEEMVAMVKSLNSHRRANTKPLTNAEKGARIEAALKTDPARSDRAIAEECGVTNKTVAAHRKELGEEIPHPTPPPERKSRSGKKGEGQHKTPAAAKPKPKRKSAANPVVTALNSLAWSNASPGLRQKFVGDVGLKHLFGAAAKSDQSSFSDWILANAGGERDPKARALHKPPDSDLDLPDFLDRRGVHATSSEDEKIN
jgi:hypothetical protein